MQEYSQKARLSVLFPTVNQTGTFLGCPILLPTAYLLRTPVVPCSVLLRSGFGPMERSGND